MNEKQPGQFNYGSLVTDNPIAWISLIGIIMAVSFNLGYFFSIGLQFMPIFSIQESIVFSVSGSVVTMTTIYGWVYFMGLLHVKGDVIRIGESSRRLLLLISLIFCIISIILSLFPFYMHNSIKVTFAAATFLVSIVLAFVLFDNILGLDKRRHIALSLLLAPFIPLSSGYLYGTIVQNDKIIGSKIVGTLPSGATMSIIRLGSSFSLAIDESGITHAIKTDSFRDIFAVPVSAGAEKTPKPKPGAL